MKPGTPVQMYQRMQRAGYVPYLVPPRPIANAVRVMLGERPYRTLGGWLPPRP